MVGIRFDRVSKRFGDIRAVDEVSLVIPDGAFVILVGPSGCGKTTLLRMLAGLEEVSSGRVYIDDRDVTRLHPRDRDIAMVFQSYALYPHMTVRRNLSFSLEIRALPRSEIDRRIEDVADILGIADLMGRRPRELSGGQRQRVALGRAIVREPSAFLFDEPLSNLDAKLRTSMRGELIKLHRRLKATIVYVTHDQVEAMTMGEVIVVMKDGAIQQQGAPLDIYNDPDNLFVAEFIGSPAMNLFGGRLEDGLVVAGTGSFRSLSDSVGGGDPSQPAGELIVGVRPEHIRILPLGMRVDSGPSCSARVEIVEPLGSETIVEVDAGGLSLLARVSSDVHLPIGAPVQLAVDPSRIYLFDKTTGRRLRGRRPPQNLPAATP